MIRDCFGKEPGYAPRAFVETMPSGRITPSAKQWQQIWLMKLLVSCVLGLMAFAPSTAFAAAIPMCSLFAECAEAPPPGTTPTGGELRAGSRDVFVLSPSLNRAPPTDSSPLHWQLANAEPLTFVALDELVPQPRRTDHVSWRRAPTRGTPRQGVSSEVYRPPCEAE